MSQSATYAPVPRPGDRCWAETKKGAIVYIEISSVEIVTGSGWYVWGWRPGRAERLPRKYFVPRPAA
jgi:hypothetical protein